MSDDMSLVAAPGRTVYRVDRQRKRALLKHLMTENAWPRVMVYVRTKYAVARLGKQLEQDGFSVALVHNSMGKVRRTEAIQAFSDGDARILVSSDMATRGMELPASIDCMINLDLPTEPCLAQRELNWVSAKHKLFLLSHDEETALHDSPLFSDTDYRFDVVAGFAPDTEAQKSQSNGAGRETPRTTSRQVKRGRAAKKGSDRNKRNQKKPYPNARATLDENGDVNGNTLRSDNSNRSAIELACDGMRTPKKRGNTKLKNRRGYNNSPKRNSRQVPSVVIE